MKLPALIAAIAIASLGAGGAVAQAVYKCQSEGKVVYSHEPCLGAQVVETTPTQGMDKSSGTSRKGADVRRSETNRKMAEALQPIFGETPEQYEKRHRRFRLPPEAKLECARLDARLPAQEAARAAKPGAMDQEQALLQTRSRFRELRC